MLLHFGIVFVCVVATLGVLATELRGLKWIDAVGGIIISLYIMYSWYSIGRDELRKLVGHIADESYIRYFSVFRQFVC